VFLINCKKNPGRCGNLRESFRRIFEVSAESGNVLVLEASEVERVKILKELGKTGNFR
jgi:hypothetical protein